MDPDPAAGRPRRKACRRYNDPGHAHALTFSCFQRRPFLARERTCRWMVESIERARERHSFHLWAYVLMPEHVHLLIAPSTDGSAISTILAALKQRVARRAIAYVSERAPAFLERMTERRPDGRATLHFWQRGGGYDRNLWRPGHVWRMIDYIHANPVRRGLCERPADWPWSSAAEYGAAGSGPLAVDRESLPDDPRGRW